MQLTHVISALLASAMVVLNAMSASAYPEFQFSSGTAKCKQCHYSPVGGGLLNTYGRDEAGSTISDGDGRFLHGLFELPKAIDIGGDLRAAGLIAKVREGNERAVFPMQGDLYLRVASKRWSLYGTLGVLAAIREPKPVIDRIGVREYYAMYRKRGKFYVRAGRFFPAQGLRGPDHTAFVRRFTGLYLLEEHHAIALGLERGQTDWTASIITPLELHPNVGQHGWGGSLNWERINDDETASISFGFRGLVGDDGPQGWAVATWKRWIEVSNLMLMAEFDVGAVDLPGAGSIARAAALATVHWRPAHKYGLAVSAHYFDSNIRFLAQERAALDVSGRMFWNGHVELALLLRGEQGLSTEPQALALLQLHYFL